MFQAIMLSTKSLSIIDTIGRPDNMVIGSCKVGNWNGWGDLAKGGSTSYVRKRDPKQAVYSSPANFHKKIFPNWQEAHLAP
jgi:hypothetical protein